MTTTQERPNPIRETTFSVLRERLVTYARLWDFETWLRTLVYVELKSAYGDAWDSHLHQGAKSDRNQKGDSYLSHMPTRETLKTSYMQLTDLLSTLLNNWELFQPYLPPKEVWEGKLHEVKQIRNRIAHFRTGHRHDASRVEQASMIESVDPLQRRQLHRFKMAPGGPRRRMIPVTVAPGGTRCDSRLARQDAGLRGAYTMLSTGNQLCAEAACRIETCESRAFFVIWSHSSCRPSRIISSRLSVEIR